jgi:hypothetical protein
MYQQLWGYKVEEKLYLGVREQKRLNTTVLEDICSTQGRIKGFVGPRHFSSLGPFGDTRNIFETTVYSLLSGLMEEVGMHR